MSSTNYCQRCIKAKINHPFIQNNKHILQSCQPLLRLYRKRHNKVCFRLIKLLNYSMNYKVYSDITLKRFHKYLSAKNEKLRPDIILINNNVKEMTLIEIGIGYAVLNKENMSTLDEIQSMKQAKYQQLIQELQTSQWKVKFETIIIDSTGIITDKVKNIITKIIHTYTNIKLNKIPSIIKIYNWISSIQHLKYSIIQ